MDSATKVCTKCGECKAVTEFNKQAGRMLGIASNCKICRAKAKNKWKFANPEKVRAYDAATRKNKPEMMLSKRAKYKANNPEAVRASLAKYQENNNEAIQERARFRVASLCKLYVAQRLGVRVADCSPELIDMKREQLTIYRLTKQITNAAKQLENENEAITNNR